MGSFEWMELQTLTSDINASRSRLAQARASKDQRLIRALETEIATAEGRRDRLLSHISTHLAGTPEAAAEAALASIAAAPETLGEEPPEAAAEPATAEPAEASVGNDPAPPAVAAEDRSMEGEIIVWEQLTPGDIERAQGEIGVRRVEMLARHGEELKALETEQNELETLEQAVRAFVQRFKQDTAPAASAIVKLGEERELRAQGRG